MKSFNPTSLSGSRSNIVPFQPAVRASSRNVPQASRWTRFWEALCNLLLPSSQPVITEKRGSDGSYYQVYDPTTQTSKTFGSELETRIWLDQRFYDNSKNL